MKVNINVIIPTSKGIIVARSIRLKRLPYTATQRIVKIEQCLPPIPFPIMTGGIHRVASEESSEPARLPTSCVVLLTELRGR